MLRVGPVLTNILEIFSNKTKLYYIDDNAMKPKIDQIINKFIISIKGSITKDKNLIVRS